MATKTFDELIAGATVIKNNELPESNTHNLVGGQLIDMANKYKESDQQSDVINVTTKFPLTAGSYYTSSTARAAVTAEYRKLGKKLIYQTAAGTWIEEKFIGSAITDAIWNADANWLGVASKNDVAQLSTDLNTHITSLELQVSGFNISSDIGGTGADYPIILKQGKIYDFYLSANDVEASVIITINNGDLPRLYANNHYQYTAESDISSIYIWWVKPCSLNIQDLLSLQLLREKINTQGDKIEVQQGNLDNINNIESVTKPAIQIISGKYITSDGSVGNDSGSSMTATFVLPKGFSAVIEAGGYLNAHSIFAEVIEANVSYKPLVISIDSTKRLYTYYNTSDSDINIAVSCDHNVTGSIIVLEYNNKVLSKLLKGNVQKVTPDLISGKYITDSGSIGNDLPCSYSKPFLVKKGETIHLIATGYLSTFSMIAKVIEENISYDPCVISHDGVNDYSFINNGDDAQFAVSFISSYGFIIEIIHAENTIFLTKYTDNKVNILEESGFLSNAFSGIPIVGVIGDSLSSGVTHNENDEEITNYNLAWWKVLERDSGMTYKGFCKGGMSTKTWLIDANYGLPKALEIGNKCCAYIICLGVNDQYYGDTIGSISDINDLNYNNNADTFYGNYGKIIQALTENSPKSKFMLTTVPRTINEAYNEAIRIISNHFSNCYLIDLALNEMDFYNFGFIQNSKFGGGHYSAAAYAVMGKVMEKEISNVIINNVVDFRYIQFAID